MISWLSIVALICGTLHCSDALFEDQVGKFDWRHRYVGKPLVTAYDLLNAPSRPKLLLSTKENVIASIALKSGSIEWRKVLADQIVDTVLIPSHKRIFTLSIVGKSGLVRCWDSETGLFRWEKLVSEKHILNGIRLILVDADRTRTARVAVVSGPAVSFLDADGEQATTVGGLSLGAVLVGTEYNHDSGDFALVTSASRMAGPRITTVSLRTASAGQDRPVFNTPAIFKSCKVVHAAVFCIQQTIGGALVHYARLDSLDNSQTEALPDMGRDAAVSFVEVSDPDAACPVVALLIERPGAAGFTHVYRFTSSKMELIFKLAEVDVMSVYGCYAVIGQFARGSSASVLGLQWYDLNDGGRHESSFMSKVKMSAHADPPAKLLPVLKRKRDGTDTPVPFVTLIGHDDSIVHSGPGDKVMWIREEALARVLSVEMLDLPLSEAQANIEEEFASDRGLAKMFVRRIKSQLHQIQSLTDVVAQGLHRLQGLLATLLADVFPFLPKEDRTFSEKFKELFSPKNTGLGHLHRDYFCLHKMIVAVTSVGKVYGIDNRQGRVVWQLILPGIEPMLRNGQQTLPLFVLRTTAHHPHRPVAVIVAKNAVTGRSSLVVFEPITGELIEKQHYDFVITQAFPSPGMDSEGLKKLIMLSSDSQAHVYTATTSETADDSARDPLYTFLANSTTGRVSGYQIRLQSSGRIATARSTWTTDLLMGSHGRLTNLKMKNPSEHVHSQGRVLGDRSVLYKYLNPNLVVATVESDEGEGKAQITLHLFDAVSGSMIASVEQKRAVGPVHIVHCENWIVYTFWNLKARRTELAVLELYEGTSQADPTRFSSFAPPGPPILMRQAYVAPFVVSSMAVTATEKGLTSRLLLMATPNGGILQLPKMFADPRRPILPTPEHREEGLIPYIPELPAPTEQILNYNQTLENVRGIYAAPAGLESTSLIFAYGLDVFCTRVTPSGTFDILKEDFDHWLIAAVLFALAAASLISKRFARHRDLKQAWK